MLPHVVVVLLTIYHFIFNIFLPHWCTSMLLDQTTLVLVVTNGDLIWTIGVSYVVHVRGYSGYTPCTPTSHVRVLWSTRYCASLSTVIDEDEIW